MSLAASIFVAAVAIWAAAAFLRVALMPHGSKHLTKDE